MSESATTAHTTETARAWWVLECTGGVTIYVVPRPIALFGHKALNAQLEGPRAEAPPAGLRGRADPGGGPLGGPLVGPLGGPLGTSPRLSAGTSNGQHQGASTKVPALVHAVGAAALLVGSRRRGGERAAWRWLWAAKFWLYSFGRHLSHLSVHIYIHMSPTRLVARLPITLVAMEPINTTLDPTPTQVRPLGKAGFLVLKHCQSSLKHCLSARGAASHPQLHPHQADHRPPLRNVRPGFNRRTAERQGKGNVSATKAVEIHKAKAVCSQWNTQGKGGVLPDEVAHGASGHVLALSILGAPADPSSEGPGHSPHLWSLGSLHPTAEPPPGKTLVSWQNSSDQNAPVSSRTAAEAQGKPLGAMIERRRKRKERQCAIGATPG